ncbi:MAG: DUF2239 family protein [Afipia sp.]|nr:DUF2239 family protein [Afipia sp.]OJW63150.1 MAG: hypothetical protein BGO65_06995 [Afipia sp. 64-13]
MSATTAIIAFEGDRCIASGELADVALKVKNYLTAHDGATILAFDRETSRPVEIDIRGSRDEVAARLKAQFSSDVSPAAEETARGPGRPRLGVVAREITLLPRHWEWLASQPGGASVTIRKLVDDARRASLEKDQLRTRQESAHRFMSALAGDKPSYEEALRALYAKDGARFRSLIANWPADVRGHVEYLTSVLFDAAPV